MSTSPKVATSCVGVETENDLNFNQLLYAVKKEGRAEILIANTDSHDKKYKKSGQNEEVAEAVPPVAAQAPPQSVFYNPIQQFNRDLSVLAVKAFAEDWAAFKQARRSRKENNSPWKRPGNRKRKRETEDDKASERCHATAAASNVKSVRSTDTSTIVVENTSLNEKKIEAEEGISGKDKEGSLTFDGTLEEEAENPKASNAVDPGERIQHDIPAANDRSREMPIGGEKKQPFVVLDALSATGLRALRYALEVPQVTSVNANDLSHSAIESIRQNILHNGLEGKVTTTQADAIEHMYSVATRASPSIRSYQVIDLDPYGTATPFLDAAIQAVDNGGLLCVTCTDASVFASLGYLEKSFSQYGGLPLKGSHAHEAGLRLILHALATSAARYGISVEPLLSLSIDFYARVFVRVRKSPADVKFLASKTMFVYNCDQGCGAWETQFLTQARPKENKNGELLFKFTSALGPEADKECEHCGFRTHLAGPMWGGPLHHSLFIERILDMLPHLDQTVYQTTERIEGVLSTMLEECFEDPWGSLTTSSHRGQDERAVNANTEKSSEVLAKPSEKDYHSQRQVEAFKPSSVNRPIPPMPPQYRTNHPFFVHPPHLARALNVPTPSDRELRGALRRLGYRATRSHTKAGSIATDAPWRVIWEIMREWIRQKGIPCSPKYGTVAWRIMRKDRSRADLEQFKDEVAAKVGAAQTIEQIKTQLEAGLGRLSSLTASSKNEHTATAQQDQLDMKTAHMSAPPPRSTYEFPDADQRDDTEQAGAASDSADANAIQTSGVSGIELGGRGGSSKDRSLQPLHALTIHFDEKLGTDRPITSEVQQAKPGSETTASNGEGKNKRAKTITRYQINPANWGPLSRARGK